MLALASGVSSLVVAPEFGAGVVGWMAGRTPIFRRALPQATIGGDPHAMGCFPLLPYGNRLAGGCFRWRGTAYRLKGNFGDHPHSIHGVGWQRVWTVVEVGQGAVTLGLDHQPDESWPFAFQAVVGYRLTAMALTVIIRLTNRHDGPAPAGIGLHPFFPKSGDPALRFSAGGVWGNGDDSLPLCHGAIPADWAHHQARAVALSRLDNCFTGWDGTADVIGPVPGVRIEASDVFRHLQVFTPSWANFFCVEPVSHVPDAINRRDLSADQAMHVLEPDETLGGTVRLCLVD
jgi:aldose 1-epimerase